MKPFPRARAWCWLCSRRPPKSPTSDTRPLDTCWRRVSLSIRSVSRVSHGTYLRWLPLTNPARKVLIPLFFVAATISPTAWGAPLSKAAGPMLIMYYKQYLPFCGMSVLLCVIPLALKPRTRDRAEFFPSRTRMACASIRLARSIAEWLCLAAAQSM